MNVGFNMVITDAKCKMFKFTSHVKISDMSECGSMCAVWWGS